MGSRAVAWQRVDEAATAILEEVVANVAAEVDQVLMDMVHRAVEEELEVPPELRDYILPVNLQQLQLQHAAKELFQGSLSGKAAAAQVTSRLDSAVTAHTAAETEAMAPSLPQTSDAPMVATSTTEATARKKSVEASVPAAPPTGATNRPTGQSSAPVPPASAGANEVSLTSSACSLRFEPLPPTFASSSPPIKAKLPEAPSHGGSQPRLSALDAADYEDDFEEEDEGDGPQNDEEDDDEDSEDGGHELHDAESAGVEAAALRPPAEDDSAVHESDDEELSSGAASYRGPDNGNSLSDELSEGEVREEFIAQDSDEDIGGD